MTNDKKIWQLPTILVLFIPLIMWGTVYENHLSEFTWYVKDAELFDVFLIGKKNAILFLELLNAIGIACRIAFRKVDIKKLKFFIPVGIYVLLVFISTFASEYSYFGFHGIVEQFESVWVILSYVVCCIYAFLISEELVNSRLFWNMFAVSALLVGLIGTLQTFGIDVLQTDMMRGIYMASVPDLSLSFAASDGTAYCTLVNPDYVGVYVNLVAPLIVWSFFRCKYVYEKVMNAVSFILCLISLIGSHSLAGILVAGFSILLSLLFAFGRKNKAFRIGSIVLAVGVVCVVLFGIIVTFSEKTEPDTKLTSISMDEDAVRITYDGYELVLMLDSDVRGMAVTDANGEPYEIYRNEQGLYEFENPGLKEIFLAPVQYGDYSCVDLMIDDYNILFTRMDDGRYSYVNLFASAEQYCSGNVPTCSVLDGHEQMLNGRGYIWSRTIPLLTDCIFLGKGQDTFAIYFPNNDYLGRINYGYEDVLITKPHSIYLQIAVQSGVLSVIAYIGMFVIFCLLFFRKKGFTAFFISITSFMILGLTNDSMIGCSILYWVILGLGIPNCSENRK